MKKGNEYKCSYTSGGGTEYDEGNWRLKTLTLKTIIVEKISENTVYGNYEKGERIVCKKGNGNPLEDWGDGTFTIYPQQGGTPYYFEAIEEGKNETQRRI